MSCFKNRLIILIILISMFLFIGCNRSNSQKTQSTYRKKDKMDNESSQISQKDNIDQEIIEEDEIMKKLKEMTLEEKVGQLIIAGLDGEDLSERDIELIKTHKIGGFILFSRNISSKEQTLKLTNSLKMENSKNDIALFISIDEEGGKVSRLPNSYVKLPEAMNIGNKNNKEVSFQLGQILGKRVKSLGFNLNFAPVLDIYSNPANRVIGNRAYGKTAEQVFNNGIEVMQGIRSSSIIPTVKHFPGHGDTIMDSHIDLPLINKTLEELEDLELIPFRKAIEEEVEMIMIAHIMYPQLDKEYPSSMSQAIIGDLLREKMGYEGVIVSDDMTMGAISKNYGLEKGLVEFIKAGGDLALICHGKEDPVLGINRIIQAVNNGELDEKEIDRKVYRILNLKKKFHLKDKVLEEIHLEELNKESKDFIKKVSN